MSRFVVLEFSSDFQAAAFANTVRYEQQVETATEVFPVQVPRLLETRPRFIDPGPESVSIHMETELLIRSVRRL